MTYLTDRDTLVRALHDAALKDHPPGHTWEAVVDDLIATGSVTDAATLADDEDLVDAMAWDLCAGEAEEYPTARLLITEPALRALASALAKRARA